MKKYKIIRLPQEAYENLNRKRIAMQETIIKETHKPIKLKFTDTIRYLSQRPSYIYNDELVNYFIKNKKKKQGGDII